MIETILNAIKNEYTRVSNDAGVLIAVVWMTCVFPLLFIPCLITAILVAPFES